MSFCERNHRVAYSEDLRWRMVWQKSILGYTYEQVTSNLNVDKSTVWRMVKLFDETGNVTKKTYSYFPGQSLRKLTRPVELSILHVVLSHPGIYLREIKSELLELTRVDVSLATNAGF